MEKLYIIYTCLTSFLLGYFGIGYFLARKSIKETDKLEKTLKEVREERDKVYNKHNKKIAYYKKCKLAYFLTIKENFISNENIQLLLKEDYREYMKKSIDELEKIKKNLDKNK